MKGNADERLDQTPQRFTALSGVFGGGDTGMANQTPLGLLAEAGAPVANLDDVERFASACLAGDERTARKMPAADPDLLRRTPQDMVARVVGTRRIEAVKLALDVGFDPNWQDEAAAIHESGVLAQHDDILRLLIARGASVCLRDPWYDGTAVEWASFFDHHELRDRLLNGAPICLFDALDYDRLDRVADVLARDPDSLDRPFAKRLSRRNPRTGTRRSCEWSCGARRKRCACSSRTRACGIRTDDRCSTSRVARDFARSRRCSTATCSRPGAPPDLPKG